MKFPFGTGTGDQTDHNGDQKTGGPGGNGDPEVLRHGGGELMNVGDPAAFPFGDGNAVSHGRGQGAAEEADESAVAGSALPEHAEQEGPEEGRVDEAED